MQRRKPAHPLPLWPQSDLQRWVLAAKVLCLISNPPIFLLISSWADAHDLQIKCLVNQQSASDPAWSCYQTCFPSMRLLGHEPLTPPPPGGLIWGEGQCVLLLARNNHSRPITGYLQLVVLSRSELTHEFTHQGDKPTKNVMSQSAVGTAISSQDELRSLKCTIKVNNNFI